MWLVGVDGFYVCLAVGRYAWVKSTGVAIGYGCKEVYLYIDILILLIPTLYVSVLFSRSIPTFCSLFKKFFVLCNISWKYIAMQVSHIIHHSIHSI